MKVPEEHAEYESGGDPLPSKIDRRRRKPSVLAILVLLVAALAVYNTAEINAVFRQQFPGTGQLFSIQPAYTFASPTSNGVLVAGSYVNVSLKIVSIAGGSTPLTLSFNASNPIEWGVIAGPGDSCHIPNLFQMSINGAYFLPSNEDPFGANANSACGAASAQSVSVTINPGTTIVTGRISASLNVPPESFTLFWFATQ